ncbi:MAG: DUF4864 domain-containing protein [Chlamydiales bacterium]|nr:DUF4864 domain-containing protein [Chlamydiales bacterium]
MGKEDTIAIQDKKNVPSWLKVVISLAILAAVAVCLAIYFTQDLVKTAEGQLSAIRARDFSRAYFEYTAKDFKASTSLEAFQEFIKSHPALVNNENANFNERTIENSVGTLHGTLISKDGGVTPIEYKFVKEGDRWKVLSMRLVPTGAVAAGIDSSRISELVEPVEAQLGAFRGNDIAKAYFGYVSKDFQDTTPLKSFREFVQNYPILTRHHSATFSDGNVEGKQGTLEAVLNGPDMTTVVEYKLSKEDGKWKIWSMRLNLPTESANREASATEIEDVTTPVEALLAYLRAGDYTRAYYEHAAKEFQSATSLDAFREFVRAYPSLTEHKTVSFESPSLHDEAATVVAMLSSPNGTTPVEYQLIKNGKNWKVWSMQILSKPNMATNAPSFNTSDLVNTIESQLTALRNGDVSKAYYAFTSRDFQRTTSASAFEKFIQSHPVLNNNQVANFSNLSFKNEVGTFQGSLTSTDKQSSRVEYDLVYEDGKWRILSIQLLSDNDTTARVDNTRARSSNQLADNSSKTVKPLGKQPSGSTMEIAKMVIGNTVDAEGHVRNGSTRFAPDSSDLHVDLYVNNAVAGGKTELIMEHVESKTRVPPVETRIDQAGDTVLSFIFTPPANGWPKGNYRLIARASNGREKIQDFRVE